MLVQPKKINLLLLLPPVPCVEMVTWPFVVITICPSCACLLVKKTCWSSKKKLQKINLPGPPDTDRSPAAAAVAAVSMC
jgi:hypothetical protein